ncbi:hypothetical protein [Chryseobacterium sp. HSC-36S06]|uniref:hypothetical protein n=1 Tax=Chryseobacterium sp. HSC-36S06 TaxID=2910970 RepID=UPI00209D1298|nr:hypothetical protein [Chryseobacterium sp. HSC-36S06]MCP2039023.1 hypothetical protein [Chryseobacterium sp. HSC-36S06]
MIQNITTNWNIFRILRLALGLFLMTEAIRTGNWFMTVFATAMIIMPLLNIGCCAGGNCAVTDSKSSGSDAEEVEFEEVQSK